MKCFVSCVTYEPKLRPTMQCHVGLYFLSNSFLMNAAISFSMLYRSSAWDAQSTASCCMSSAMSEFLITALRSAIGCAGFVSGQEWTAQLLAAYQKQYGSSPPLDVWGIHTYSITWDQLPMVNAARDIQQLQELRRYLSSQTAERQKPIWLTEFGVIWGFEGYQFVGDGECANRSHCLGPEGRFRDDLIAAYLNTLLDWLTANADGHNIERWFLYTSYGGREPYASTYAGISLLTAGGTDAVLSAFGEQYRHAVGQP